MQPRELEKVGIHFAVFLIKYRVTNAASVPRVVYLYDLQMSIAKHFPWSQSNLNLKIKRKWNFDTILWLEMFQI